MARDRKVKKPPRPVAGEAAVPADSFAGVPVDRALDKVIRALTEEFGVGAVSRLSDEGAYTEVKHVIPTGLPALDAALGVGGLPLGRIVEIYGPEHVGKSSLANWLLAQAQLRAIAAHKIEMETSGAAQYDTALGMQAQRTLISQPDTAEQVIGILYTGIPIMEAAGVPFLYVWDSLAATPTKAEMEAEIEDAEAPAVRARFLSRHLKKLSKLFKSGNVGCIMVNQIREKIGAKPWEKQTYSVGGRALRHYAHLRLELGAEGQIRKGDDVVGIKVRVKVVKNKVAPPFKEAHLHFYFVPPRFEDPTAEKVRRQPMKVAREDAAQSEPAE